MCGIFTILNSQYEKSDISENFEKGKSRGPEHSQLVDVGHKIKMGFHRLAINGLNMESTQPITRNNIWLICNGEIYNYKKLYEMMGVIPNTQSDCEVILWLYEKYGIEQCLQMLDGVFAFVLLDQRIENAESVVYIARDPYGVRPLYKMEDHVGSYFDHSISFASEMKMLHGLSKTYDITPFTPGTWSSYVLKTTVNAKWEPLQTEMVYHNTGFFENFTETHHLRIIKGIREKLYAAVEKRCCTTERPIACLLSGGLDSSLIAALVSQYHKENGLPALETYSIGLEGSVDLKYAKLVAEHLCTKHTEIILTERDFCDAIPEVIYAIESYDTTTVRASIGNYLLGKYIAANSEAKVIFNGDGSDELLGGYLYMKKADDSIEFDKECRRLLKEIHMFDVLRSDKCISSHGLEPRTPFLDRGFTQYILSLPCDIRHQPHTIEKYWLRQAFSMDELLPLEVLWRKKEAFSDGVSDTSRSLYDILQEHAERELGSEEMDATKWAHNPPATKEQYYYRKIFEEYYANCGGVIPHMWMPKYVYAQDASARTLAIYDE
jgi:asparagine synthase (glutamine-hydrolysing)